jgi:hypothetical protein
VKLTEYNAVNNSGENGTSTLGNTYRTFDMKTVTSPANGEFLLLCRDDLMKKLKSLVPESSIKYNANVTQINNNANGDGG